MRRTETEEVKSLLWPCLCVCHGKSLKCGLPGKVVVTVRFDAQVASSSPPAQSFLPSHAFSIGMNVSVLVQKKYLLSISCLTEGRGSGLERRFG